MLQTKSNDSKVSQRFPMIGTRKTPVWVKATGTIKTRIKKASFYLSRASWVPQDACDGDKAILIVVTNLRRYFQLCSRTTVSLIVRFYNPRCVTADGRSWAWSEFSIERKYRQAGKRGIYPTLGVRDPKAIRLAKKLEAVRQLRFFWRKFVRPGGRCTPAELRAAFVAFRGGEDITPNMLSRIIRSVTGLRPITPFGMKMYRGVHIAETHLGLTHNTGLPGSDC